MRFENRGVKMTELLTAAQMKAIEESAIHGGEASGLELMERAGQGVLDAVFAEWPELGEAPGRAAVLCGPGNNGGDGFVAARLLKARGWAMEVFLYGSAGKLPGDARTNCERWGAGNHRPLDDPAVASEATGFPLVFDAGFGTGLSRSLPAEFAAAFAALNTSRNCRVVAVDIPSGLCADSGRVLGEGPGAVCKADLTVTFHRAKLGHYLAEGPACCGRLAVMDIGL